MTREEIIESAAREHYLESTEYKSFIKGFEEGVKYAQTKPKWHKYPDELPPIPKHGESQYLVTIHSQLHDYCRLDEYAWNGHEFEKCKSDLRDDECIISWKNLWPEPPDLD